MRFQRASEADLPAIAPVLVEAAEWLKGKGIDQWTQTTPDTVLSILGKRFREGEVYFAAPDGKPIATLSVQWQDPFYWGERGDDGQAGYVHSMAVLRSWAGKGLGDMMLSFAEGLVRERGRHLLRLDCMAANPVLCHYYATRGFQEAGFKEWDRFRVRLYEKKVVTQNGS